MLAIVISALMITANIVYAVRKNKRYVILRNLYIARLFTEAARFYTLIAMLLFVSVALGKADEPGNVRSHAWVCFGIVIIFSAIAPVYNARQRTD